jgi:putative redox protein
VADAPQTVVDLTWLGELRFETTTRHGALRLDASGLTGPSPTDALAAAIGGCMAMDITSMLVRGRHPLRGFKAHLTAERAVDHPRRFVAVSLRLTVQGSVPPAAIDRAIALSRDKYCPVWNSLRGDIPLTVTYDFVA